MHAAPRHGTATLTSLPKDGGVSCFGRSSGRSPIQFLDRTQPCLTSVKLMELAGPLGLSKDATGDKTRHDKKMSMSR